MTRTTRNILGARAQMVAVLVSAVLVVTAAANGVTVDGRVTPADGYTIMKTLRFTVENTTGTQTGAAMWLYQDPNSHDLFVAFSLPTSLVDNSYGSDPIGWGSKTHTSQNLSGSDKAQFVIKDAEGLKLFDVTMDYLHGLGESKDYPPFVGGMTDGHEFALATGNDTDILASTTSMASNWDTFGAGHPENLQYFGKDSNSPGADTHYLNSALSGWLYEVTYEFQIAGGVFDESTLNLLALDSVTVPIVHASPNKIGGNKVENFTVIETYENTPQDPIPEPVTMASLVLGVGSLAGYLRRRTR